jgi:probable rRNA maturation factor
VTVQHANEDTRRAIYVGPWRIDLARRVGVAQPLPALAIARQVQRALSASGAPRPGSVTVVLTDDDELADLNREHMGHEGPTDVLSFPMLSPEAFGRSGGTGNGRIARRMTEPGPRGRTHIGDIAISVERAADQASEGRGGQTGDVRWSTADELRLLVTHGTLHLCGLDHAEPAEEAAMRTLERRLLELGEG